MVKVELHSITVERETIMKSDILAEGEGNFLATIVFDFFVPVSRESGRDLLI